MKKTHYLNTSNSNVWSDIGFVFIINVFCPMHYVIEQPLVTHWGLFCFIDRGALPCLSQAPLSTPPPALPPDKVTNL